MKCIKLECDFCKQDMFKASVLECTVSNDFCKFKKDSDVDCIIDKAINYHKNRVDCLEKYQSAIEMYIRKKKV